MTVRLYTSPAARDDRREIGSYLYGETYDRDLVRRWFTSVRAETAYAVEYPRQTPPLIGFSNRPEGPLRRRIITGFKNYLLFYRFDENTVTVTRILHGSRDLRRVPDL
ncbi:MAG: type II toxin-antitoxin system RelE/ParE family toxin [Planctomycetota bacterium]